MFEKYTVKQLQEVAEYYGVDLENVKGKANVIAAIEADGVSYEDAEKQVFNAEIDEDDEFVVEVPRSNPVVDPTAVNTLVKMTRLNARYDVEANGRVYTFRKEAPFALMSEDDADVVCEREEGFRIASPREAREFYG